MPLLVTNKSYILGLLHSIKEVLMKDAVYAIIMLSLALSIAYVLTEWSQGTLDPTGMLCGPRCRELKCDGCVLPGGPCVPVGTRLYDRLERTNIVCNSRERLVQQRDTGWPCDVSFECQSNSCTQGTCDNPLENMQGTYRLS